MANSPFPGMDPYLEAQFIWADFHHSLAGEIKSQLNRQLGSRYFAAVELTTMPEQVGIGTARPIHPDTGVYERDRPPYPPRAVAPAHAVLDKPAVSRAAISADEIKLRSVNISTLPDGDLVTAVEILSPVNKRGHGATKYKEKQSNILYSLVHLVEIDLLRGGRTPAWEMESAEREACDYTVIVNRHQPDSDRVSDIWTITLDQPLPTIPVPLLSPDPDVTLDLGDALDKIYVDSLYQYRIDYSQKPPPPALRPDMATWWQERRMELNS